MWEGSVERNCEPMDKNWIQGGAEQGERAMFCEAFCGQGSGGVYLAVVQGRSAFSPGEMQNSDERAALGIQAVFESELAKAAGRYGGIFSPSKVV